MRILELVVVVSLVAGCGGSSPPRYTPTADGASGLADMAVNTPPGDMAMQSSPDDLVMGGGGDMQCKPPSTLHPPKMGMPSIYCPFSGMNGGKSIYCQQGQQHCCEPSMGTSTCTPIATACPAMNTDWQCQDPSDCGNGQQCCGTGALTIAPQGCQNFATKFNGTHCAASCAGNEIVMCTSSAECGGNTCIPFATKGAQVGGCM